MELFRIVGTIAVNNTEANRAIEETTNEATNAKKKVSDSFKSIGGAAGNIAKGLGVASTAIGGAFIATIESTREYRKEMGLLESSFVTAGHSSDTAKNTYSELNAVLGDSGQAVEASQHLAKITDDEKELQTWTDICTGVYSEFGQAIPLESLTESALEVQKNGQLTGGLVDALVWAGINEEEFQAKLDACSTEQERQDLIMNTLNDTYKDAASQYKETNKDVMDAEKANEKLADAFAELGRIGEPILTAIKEGLANMVSNAVPKLEELIEKIKDATKWVKDNEEKIQTWVGIILGAAVAIGTFLLILNWGTIMTAAAQAISVVRTAILGMNAAMLANPIGIIVALIVGLVATFIYLWNNVDGFKQFWIDAWEWIRKAASDAKDWIVKAWNNIGEWFTEKFSKIKQSAKDATEKVKKFFSDAWNAIKSVWNSVTGFFQGVWNGIKSVFNTVKSWIGGQFEGAWNLTKTVWNAYKNFFSGIWSGIKNIFGSVGSWFGEKFRNAWSNIKNAFSNWGSFFSELWGKVKNKFGDIGTKIGDAIGNSVKKAMNTALGKIEGAINKGIKLINSAIKFAGKLGFSVSTVSEVKLPRLAKGTVVDKATAAIVGEDGAEAIVPLERNTQWIDMLAGQLESRMDGISSQIMIERMNKVISLLEQMIKRNIYLDSGVLVGELSAGIDASLADRYKHAKRGNVG